MLGQLQFWNCDGSLGMQTYEIAVVGVPCVTKLVAMTPCVPYNIYQLFLAPFLNEVLLSVIGNMLLQLVSVWCCHQVQVCNWS